MTRPDTPEPPSTEAPKTEANDPHEARRMVKTVDRKRAAQARRTGPPRADLLTDLAAAPDEWLFDAIGIVEELHPTPPLAERVEAAVRRAYPGIKG